MEPSHPGFALGLARLDAARNAGHAPHREVLAVPGERMVARHLAPLRVRPHEHALPQRTAAEESIPKHVCVRMCDRATLAQSRRWQASLCPLYVRSMAQSRRWQPPTGQRAGRGRLQRCGAARWLGSCRGGRAGARGRLARPVAKVLRRALGHDRGGVLLRPSRRVLPFPPLLSCGEAQSRFLGVDRDSGRGELAPVTVSAVRVSCNSFNVQMK